MTNSQELRVEMVRHGDTGIKLAEFLGISHPTFSGKLNNNSEFTQGEIASIGKRYELSGERVMEIFFD